MVISRLDRNERKELDALSKEIFGQTNRWRKLVDQGYSELVTRHVEEEVPNENGEGTTLRMVQIPVLTESGGKQYKQKYHTVESIKEVMLKIKSEIEENRKKQEMEKRQKEVSNALSGSAAAVR